MWLQKQDGASGVKSKDKWSFEAALLSIFFLLEPIYFSDPW